VSATAELAAILSRPIDGTTRARAVWHVLDWVAVAALGATSPVGCAMAAYGRGQPAGRCHAFGAGLRTAEAATLVNGELGNIFELDDIHRTSIVHPGDVVMPAALAAAERAEASGPALLDAVVRGYEAAIRIGTAAGRGHYALWYNTATCGVFGAAAAVADLLGLDARAMVDALGQAGAQAAGTWQCRIEPTDTKQLLTARAAQSGLIAADLTALGLTGPAKILDGTYGLFAATAPDADPTRVAADPDGSWRLVDVSFKVWPACRHAHPAIEAALALRDRIGDAGIKRIEVETYAEAIAFCDRLCPTTPHEARFSLQYCTALAVLKGAPRLEHFSPEAIGDRDVLALAARVVLTEDAAMTRAFPNRYPARITIWLADGSSPSWEVTTAFGDPENPLAEANLLAKARTLLRAAGHDAAAAEATIVACRGLPDGRSPGSILAPLTAASAAAAQ
jgi:2-methylcitrate dehydratase PrpD